MSSGADPRVEELEQTLREVLSHLRPQGHANRELNTCLVTSGQVAKWWTILTPRRADTAGPPPA
ncbi:hypothetical protein ACF1BP_21640 [Streptomyces sp. NPDC014735]|uniref:hypothetical protein n=1 Tax=Streptomyces sp. NPDC014735 TaxID=3364887 RepID=UPI0036FEFD3E